MTLCFHRNKCDISASIDDIFVGWQYLGTLVEYGKHIMGIHPIRQRRYNEMIRPVLHFA